MIMVNIMEYLVRKDISNQTQTTLLKPIEVIWKLESDLYFMNDFRGGPTCVDVTRVRLCDTEGEYNLSMKECIANVQGKGSYISAILFFSICLF